MSAHDRIRRLVEAFERSDWDEIDVRSGDVRVHLVADGRHAPERSDPMSRPPAKPSTAPAETESVRRAEHADPPASFVGAHTVAAPSPGVFWRAPEPGAPPFVEVGDQVSPDTTLCIVEVMKLMSHLKAGVAGTVVAIHVGDGEAIAKDQPVFAIDRS